MTDHDWASDSTDPPDHKAWDLLVIGGGTAGIVAAKTAAGFGAGVLIVERERTGGDCLWTGCVPSKALLSAAHAAASARNAGRLGVHADNVTVDFTEVMQHVHQSIRTIEPIDSPETLRKAGIRVIHGNASLTGQRTADIDGVGVTFRQALLATGSSPVMPDIPGLVDANPHTSDTIWSLGQLPPRLLILGGGNIGCELGQAFARLGSTVTLAQRNNRLLPQEDADAAQIIHDTLVADGVTVRCSITATKVTTEAGNHTVTFSDGTGSVFDTILVATGRKPSSASLGAEAADVETDSKGYIRVNARLQTTNSRVWAAGDITGNPQFTHTAGVHASIAASNAILGLRRSVDNANNPRVTYTHPEVASFGVSLDHASKAKGLTVRTVVHDEVDRCIAEAETNGFSRLILDNKQRVVGATIVGPRAGETLGEIVLAARNGITVRAIAGTTHAYPTHNDGIWKAAIAQIQQQLAAPFTRRAIAVASHLRHWRLR